MASRFFVELGTRQLARALGVSQRTIQRRARAGLITARKVEGRWRSPAPTSVAARALGRSETTIREGVKSGRLAGFKAEPAEAIRRYTARPPAEFVRQAKSEREPLAIGRADAWLQAEAPDWWALVHSGYALPWEAAIMLADVAAPPPAEWAGVTVTPHSDGSATATILTTDGRTIAFRMPAPPVWDLKRVADALAPEFGIEVEVEDTP